MVFVPLDCIGVIAEYLVSSKEFFALSLVCPQYHEFLSSDRIKPLYSVHVKFCISLRTLKNFLRGSNDIRLDFVSVLRLDFRRGISLDTPYTPLPDLDVGFLNLVHEKMPFISSLTIHDDNVEDSWPFILTPWRRFEFTDWGFLQKLVLINIKFRVDFCSIVSALNTLKSLSLDNSGCIKNAADDCTELFKLSWGMDLESFGIDTFWKVPDIRHLSNLRRLSICRCSSTEELRFFLFENFPLLEELDLYLTDICNMSNFDSLQDCPKLRRITYKGKELGYTDAREALKRPDVELKVETTRVKIDYRYRHYYGCYGRLDSDVWERLTNLLQMIPVNDSPPSDVMTILPIKPDTAFEHS